MEMSHVGGSCDCGQSEAWRPEGFCPAHGTGAGRVRNHESSSRDPLETIPEDLRKGVGEVIREAWEVVAEGGAGMGGVASWLRESVCKVEALARVVRATFFDGGFAGEVTRDLPGHSGLELEQVLLLLLDVVQDPESKKKFVPFMMNLYAAVINGDRPSDPSSLSIIHKLTPQFINTPALAVEMTFPGPDGPPSLVSSIVGKLPALLSQSLVDEATLHSRSRMLFSYLGDLVTCTDQNEVQEAMKRHPDESEAIARQWVECLAAVQNYDGEFRKTGEHVLYEHDRGFYDVLGFEEICMDATRHFSKAFSGDERLSSSFVRAITARCAQWFAEHKFVPELAESFSNPRAKLLGASAAHLEVGKSIPISLDVPLQRALAIAVSHRCSASPFSSDAQLAKRELLALLHSKLPADFPAELFYEPALQLEPWSAQVDCALWPLNGQSMKSRQWIHRVPALEALTAPDTFVLQLRCTAFGPDSFLLTILDRFGLLSWFDPTSECPAHVTSASTVAKASMASAMLASVISVLENRAFLPPCVPMAERRRLIALHLLAAADLNRSKLAAELGGWAVKDEEVDDILSGIAFFKAPTNEKPGMFSLKEEAWQDFDPWYRHVHATHLQQALERHKELLKKHPPTKPLWSGRKIREAVEPFRTALLDLLHSPLLCRVLATFAEQERLEPGKQSDILLASLVRLGWLMEENPPTSDRTEQQREQLGAFVVALRSLCLIGEDSPVFAENKFLHSSMQELAIALGPKSSTDAANAISSWQKELHGVSGSGALAVPSAPGDTAALSSSPGVADKREMARRRQAAMLEKMKQQQAAFAAKHEAPSPAAVATPPAADVNHETPAPQDAPDASADVCVLCRQAGDQEGNPLTYLAHIESSCFPWLARRNACEWSDRGQVSPEGKWTPPARTISTERRSKITDEHWMATVSKDYEGETFADVEEMRCIQISGCLHSIHANCFRTHTASLLSSGRQLVSAEHGDLLCPLCRRVENVALPLVSRSVIPVSTDAALVPPHGEAYSNGWLVSLRAIMSSFLNRTNRSPLPAHVSSLLEDFAKRVTLIHREILISESASLVSSNHTSMILANALAGCLTSAEIAWRSGVPEAIWKSQSQLISRLGDAAVISGCDPESFVELFALMSWTLLLPLKSDQALFPFSIVSLNCDPFSLLTRLVTLIGVDHFEALFWLTYTLAIAQALLHLFSVSSALPSRTTLDIKSEDDSALVRLQDIVSSVLAHPTTEHRPLSGEGVRPSRTIETCLKEKGHSLSELVRLITEPFLRRASLLREVIKGSLSAVAPTFTIRTPTVAELLGTPGVSQLVTEWLWQFHAFSSRQVNQPSRVPYLSLGPARPMSFITLPNTFQDLLLAVHGLPCRMCSAEADDHQALCLVCGDIVCAQTTECVDPRPLWFHSTLCDGGCGIFLLLHSTRLLIVRGTRATVVRSFYRDALGEEDVDFKRGKLLTLNREVFRKLEDLWRSSYFDQDPTISSGTQPALL